MNVSSILIIGLLTLATGYSDSRGFVYASQVWTSDGIAWRAVLFSALGFTAGIPSYLLTIRYLQHLGVHATEVQAALWFVVTIIGVAIASGDFLEWRFMDKWVAAIVCIGTLWLVVRTGA